MRATPPAEELIAFLPIDTAIGTVVALLLFLTPWGRMPPLLPKASDER